MTNEELTAAISRTTAVLKSTGTSYDYYKLHLHHLASLLDVEAERAKTTVTPNPRSK